MTAHTATQSAPQAGFTLMEVAVVLVFATLMVLTLQSSMLATVKTKQRTASSDAVQTQAYEFLQRLSAIPFGTATDGPATAAQLDELFDADTDLGNVTLRQLLVAPTAPGFAFTTRRDGVATTWRVHVSTDLDGDGTLSGFREDRPDIAAIAIFAGDRRLFHSVRAADYVNTRRDP